MIKLRNSQKFSQPVKDVENTSMTLGKCNNKMPQNFYYFKITKLRCSESIVFYSISCKIKSQR